MEHWQILVTSALLGVLLYGLAGGLPSLAALAGLGILVIA